jgi:hypothetical protein
MATLDENRENEVSIFSMLHLKGSNTVLVAVVSRIGCGVKGVGSRVSGVGCRVDCFGCTVLVLQPEPRANQGSGEIHEID